MTKGRRLLFWTSLLLFVVGGVGLLWHWNTRPRVLGVAAPPPDAFPADGFSHASFEDLLRRFVDARGGVDYATWHQDADARVQLDRYLGALAAFSPENTPDRFPVESDRVVYWVHAYNAFVIHAVLEHWPLESVLDVRAPVEVVRGLGFFGTLQFVAGGRRYTLHTLEHEKALGEGDDVRIHFVLNCASGGCPVIRPELPTGDALDPFLARAATEFVAEPQNVAVDHESRTVTLSRLFEWYADGFVDDLRRRGIPAERGVLDYVASVAPDSLRAELARADDYEVVFADYDWSLNAAGADGE